MAKAAVIAVCAAVALWIIAYTIVTLWRERRRVRCCRNCVFGKRCGRHLYDCMLDETGEPPRSAKSSCAGYSNRYDCKLDFKRIVKVLQMKDVYTTPKAVLEIARKEATAAVYEIRQNAGAFLIEAMKGA